MISKEIFTKQAAHEPLLPTPKIPLLEKHLSPDSAVAGKAGPFVFLTFLVGLFPILGFFVRMFNKLLDIFLKHGLQKRSKEPAKREPYYSSYKDKVNDLLGRLPSKEAPSGAEAKVGKEGYYAGSAYLARIRSVKKEALATQQIIHEKGGPSPTISHATDLTEYHYAVGAEELMERWKKSDRRSAPKPS